MKVVLFCGGLGTRLRENSEIIPKPLVNIGPRPIIWHLMRYYAHFGHKDFILCLGYRGDSIRDYFLNYNRYLMGDVTLDGSNGVVIPEKSDIADWRITFVDTGLHSNVGQRLLRVRKYLEDEPMFLANYSDQLTDLPLDRYISDFEKADATVGLLSVKPSSLSYHLINLEENGLVNSLDPISEADYWVDGGYFVMRQDIFNYIKEGEDLVKEPFARLAAERKLWSHRYTGYWKAMDTFKDKIIYDRMWGREDVPWEAWKDDD